MTPDRLLLTALVLTGLLTLCWLQRVSETTQRIEHFVREAQ